MKYVQTYFILLPLKHTSRFSANILLNHCIIIFQNQISFTWKYTTSFSNEGAPEFRVQSLQEITFFFKNNIEHWVGMVVDANLKIRATVVSVTNNNPAIMNLES